MIHSDKFILRAFTGVDYNVHVFLRCMECGDEETVMVAVDRTGMRTWYDVAPDPLSKLISLGEAHWNNNHEEKT